MSPGPPALPRFVAHCGFRRQTALNVVTAALDVDERTADTPVTFASSAAEVADGLAAGAASAGPVVVGWSFVSEDFARAARELKWLRKHGDASRVLHLVGGPHATADPEATLRAGFDLCALGDGEVTTIELFAALRAGLDPTALRGLAHLREGKLVSNGRGESRPLDVFPPHNVRYRRANAIEITRGCFHGCAYCQTPSLFCSPPRHRSAKNVAAHVAAIRGPELRFLRFITPSALAYGSTDGRCNLSAIAELLATVREETGVHTRIYFGTCPSEVRPEQLSPAALRLLKRYVSNRDLAIGIQSGSQRILDAMRRGYTVDEGKQAVEMAVFAGFRPQVDLMFGFPGETGEDRAKTLRLADYIAERGGRIRGHIFVPLPGTPLEMARPEPLDAETVARLSQLESRRVLHGQWRRQQQSGKPS